MSLTTNSYRPKCPQMIKETFILFYSVSNIATAFFIIPVLPFLLSNTFGIKNYKWYNIGLVYGAYEFGKFCGNILWVKLNQYVSSSLLVIISLSLLSVFNFFFGFIKNFVVLLVIRFFLGFSNNLPIISKNIYAELSINNSLTLKLYIITGVASICGLLIPLCSFTLNYYTSNLIEKSVNQYVTASSLLTLINIITLILLLVLIYKGYLRLRTNKVFIEMNNENNDNSENIKSKRTFSIKIKKKEEEPISADRNEDKNSGRFNSTGKDEEINNNNMNYEKIDKRESIELMKKHNTLNPIHTPRNGTMNNVSTNNLGNLGSASIESANNSKDIVITNTIVIPNKEIKYASIYVLLQTNDVILLIFTISFLYVKYKSMIFVSLGLIILNFCFSIVNYPITKKIVGNLTQNEKMYISYLITILLYISIVITFIIGIIIPIYFHYIDSIIPNIFLNFIIIFLLFCLVLTRNIVNTNLIQCYQMYVTVDFHMENESMKSLNIYQNNATALFKSVFCLLSSLNIFLLTFHEEMNIWINAFSVILFIVIPEGLIGIILILVKLYM